MRKIKYLHFRDIIFLQSEYQFCWKQSQWSNTSVKSIMRLEQHLYVIQVALVTLNKYQCKVNKEARTAFIYAIQVALATLNRTPAFRQNPCFGFFLLTNFLKMLISYLFRNKVAQQGGKHKLTKICRWILYYRKKLSFIFFIIKVKRYQPCRHSLLMLPSFKSLLFFTMH